MKNGISKEKNKIKNQRKSMSIKKQKKNVRRLEIYPLNNTQENTPASDKKAVRKIDCFLRSEKKA